jgi:putative membrane protein
LKPSSYTSKESRKGTEGDKAMMGPFDGGMMGNWGAFGWLWMLVPLLFWGGLLAVIAWAVARVFPDRGTGGEPPQGRASSAEDVLRGRFARGEIDAAEYESSLRVLRGEARDENVGIGAR